MYEVYEPVIPLVEVVKGAVDFYFDYKKNPTNPDGPCEPDDRELFRNSR